MQHKRKIFSIDLYNETPIWADIYFATDKNGWGRVFDQNGFLGLAQPKTAFAPTEFSVQIFGRLTPEAPFKKRTYRSQKQANDALIRYTEKALRSQTNQPHNNK